MIHLWRLLTNAEKKMCNFGINIQRFLGTQCFALFINVICWAKVRLLAEYTTLSHHEVINPCQSFWFYRLRVLLAVCWYCFCPSGASRAQEVPLHEAKLKTFWNVWETRPSHKLNEEDLVSNGVQLVREPEAHWWLLYVCFPFYCQATISWETWITSTKHNWV